MKLNPNSTPMEVRAEWVRRLEDDGLRQIKGALCEVDEDGKPKGYCCLGVLMEMATEVGVAKRTSPRLSTHDHGDRLVMGYWVNDNYAEEATLTPAVQRWAGLPDGNPDVVASPEVCEVMRPHNFWARSHGYTTLAEMNDKGATFALIAERIRNGLHS